MNSHFLFILLSVSILIAGQSPALAGNAADGKEKTEQKKTEEPEVSKYAKTFSAEKGCVSAKGPFLSLHKADGKLYVEMPRRYLGRELLMAATVTGTSDTDVATIGYKARDPLHVHFVMRDSSIFLERVTVLPDLETPDAANGMNTGLTHLEPVLWGGGAIL